MTNKTITQILQSYSFPHKFYMKYAAASRTPSMGRQRLQFPSHAKQMLLDMIKEEFTELELILMEKEVTNDNT